MSGEHLQDHWSSGLMFSALTIRLFLLSALLFLFVSAAALTVRYFALLSTHCTITFLCYSTFYDCFSVARLAVRLFLSVAALTVRLFFLCCCTHCTIVSVIALSIRLFEYCNTHCTIVSLLQHSQYDCF